MQLKHKIYFFLFLGTLTSCVSANGINFHLASGVGWSQFDNTDAIYLNSFVKNSYQTDSQTSAPFLNIGIGYRWDSLCQKIPELAFQLGVIGFYYQAGLSGTNYPFVNVGQFDTLTYDATLQTNAIFIEPKIINTQHEWQPYVLAGIGIAWNRAMNYNEFPTNPALSAAPMPLPFGDKTTRQTAYEIGIGIQKIIMKTGTGHPLLFFADYRYMNLGKLQFATSPLQTTSRGPDLGEVQTQLVSIGLELQF